MARHIFIIGCFVVPFVLDSYSNDHVYEMLDLNIDYSNAKIIYEMGDKVQFGIKGVGIFATLSLVIFEIFKAAASDRNKYALIFKSQSHDAQENRANAINFSFFNIFLFVIYITWAVNSVQIYMKVSDFKI